MKNLMMLAVLVLGTSAMVNAQTTTEKKATTKEVKMGKHKKHHKKSVKAEVKNEEAAKMEVKTPKK